MERKGLAKIWDYASFFVMLILAFSLLQKCGENKTLEDNLQVEIDNVRQYEDLKGEIVEYNDVMNTKFKDLELYNAELKEEIHNMMIKNPEFIVLSTTELRVDTVYVPFADTLPCDDFVKNIEIDSTWYNIGMTLTKESLMIDSMIFPNEQIVTIGEKKNGLFKRNEHIVAVKNTNPYMSTDTLETYTFKKDKKFFERPSVNITLGVFAGIVISRLIGK